MKTKEFELSDELEKLEIKILKQSQKESRLEIGGILIRTAHKIRIALEYYEEELQRIYAGNKLNEN